MVILRLEDISRIYRNQGSGSAFFALRNISFEIERGEFVAVVGPSGAGKTTLFNIIGLLDSTSSGSLSIGGITVDNLSYDKKAQIRNRKIGFVFQNFNLIPNLTGYENAALQIFLRKSKLNEEDKQSICNLFRIFNIEEQLSKYPKEMSGGEQQRVAIIRALVNNPSLILADEPTGSLDSSTSQIVFEVLEKINSNRGKTVVFVTHNGDLAKKARRIIRMKDGRVESDEKNSIECPSKFTGKC